MGNRSFSNIGKFVKKHREKVGLSQTELSRALGYSKGQFISNVERGLCSVPLKHAVDLRKALDVEAHTLTTALLRDYHSTISSYLPQENDQTQDFIGG